MKRILAVLASVAALAACGATASTASDSVLLDSEIGASVEDYQLPDGRTVTCIYVYKGGISCDWTKARAR